MGRANACLSLHLDEYVNCLSPWLDIHTHTKEAHTHTYFNYVMTDGDYKCLFEFM